LLNWKNYFTYQQSLFLKKPFAPVIGNHDDYHNQFKLHFNLNYTSFDTTKKSTYTYIYGDAQFFAINSELWNNSTTYMTSLKKWMQDSVNAHKDIKWRIVYFHRPVYTGAKDEQNTPWCVPTWFNTLAPLFDELNISLVLQGHSHIYDVIGPVYNKNTVSGSVSGVTTVNEYFPQNASSKSGGFFNVQEGTLYFTNVEVN